MTPEERFNQQVWEILQDIKEESFASEKDGTFFYDTTITVVGGNSPTRERRWAIVHTLAREKVIKIVKEVSPDWQGGRNGFYLKLLQPKFDAVYKKFQKACDLNSYLDDYQRKLHKGKKNLPEFGKLKAIFATPPTYSTKSRQIADQFSPENRQFVLIVLRQIVSLIDFSTDGKVHYHLQSPSRHPNLIKERSLLKKFEAQGLFRHLGEDEIFGIVTLNNLDSELIKEVIVRLEERESAEPDKQKQLNDVMSYLSELKEKTKEAEPKKEINQLPAARIEITKMPELQIQGLDEIAKTKQRGDKPKFPHKLPAGTRWEEITIKFKDDEKVFIQVKQFKLYTNYKEMGFVGKGNNPNPSETWIFLKVLAQVNGELTIKDTKATNKYKKQKELLAKSLQSYFSIDYDPFYPYRSSSEKSGNSYKIKITLIPPPDTKEKADTNDDNNDLGIKEYLNEQNPQVYEDD